MLKKFLSTFSIVCATLFIGFFVYPDQVEASGGVIRVGYISDSGFVYDQDSFNYKGYGFDLLKQIELNTDMTFEFVPISMDQAENPDFNEVDVLGGFFAVEELLTHYTLVEPSIGNTRLALVAKNRVDDGVYFNDPQSINGKTVATYERSIANQAFENYLANNNIAVEYIISGREGYMYVEADYYLTDMQNYNNQNLLSVLSLDTYPVYLMVDSENPELAARLSSAINSLIFNDTNYFYELYEKYGYLSPETGGSIITREQEELLRSKVWRVGYSENNEPYQYIGEDGEADGISVRLLQDMATRHGFEIEFIPYNPSEQNPDPNEFDIVISLTGDLEFMKQNYTSTLPLAEYPMILFSNDNAFKSEGEGTVGMMDYLSFDYNKFDKQYPGLEIVKYTDFEQLSKDNEAGVVSSAIYSESYFELKRKQDEVAFDQYTYTTEYILLSSMFISNNLPEEFTSIFNNLTHETDEHTLHIINEQEIEKYIPEYTPLELLLEYWWLISILIALIAAAFVFEIMRGASKRKQAVLHTLNTDKLTGLKSMHLFNEQAKVLLAEADVKTHEVISIDIDYFRTINSYSGMEKGDIIIKDMAQSLVDGYEGFPVLIGRVTAEQFVILHKCYDGEGIKKIAEERILPSIRETMGKNYNVSLSVGTYVIEDPKEPINTIIDRANLARIAGKKIHKTTFITFNDKMKIEYEKMANITFRMEKALIDREFHVVYQPKIDCKTFEVCGAEALVRWKPHYGDNIYPNDFIPIFETNGFIADLDLYVFEDVCNFIKSKNRKEEMPIISINLSSFTLIQEKAIGNLIKIAKKYDIKPRQIEIEIGENPIVSFDSLMKTRINQLRVFGFHLAIDDFGTGTSSVNRLLEYKAEYVKLDKEFIENATGDESEYTVVKNIIRLIKDLNMKVVCEGVETKAQAKILVDLGCDIAQGYYFEKPLEATEFRRILNTYKSYKLDKTEAEQ